MLQRKKFIIKFAGIVIRFILPTEAVLSEELRYFLEDDSAECHTEYRVELLDEPLTINGSLLAETMEMAVWGNESGNMRIYKPLIEKNGCQVATMLGQHGIHRLYYPSIRWSFYSKELHCIHLLAIEEVLLRYDAFLLHSSVVMMDNQMILFSGPSGIGKSTQASLWKKHTPAEVINGDRCVIRKIGKKFYGCGSPWAGTSRIYRKEMAPIKSVFVLKQAEENSIRMLKMEAFSNIFQQTIVNLWNREFMENMTNLIIDFISQVSVYELSCRPDESAVQLAFNTLFEGDAEYGME